jgi:DNA polymerase-3 subunit gamma/tau
MMIQLGNADHVEATKEIRDRMQTHSSALSTSAVIRMLKAFNAAAAETRGGSQPSLALELALAQAFETPPETAAQRPDRSAARAVNTRSGQSTASATAGAATPRMSRGSVEPHAGSQPVLRQPAHHTSPATTTAGSAQTSSASSASTKEASGPIDLDRLIKLWKQVRAALKPTHPAVEALLNSCKPVELRGDELVLGFQSDTVRALMDKPEHLEAARKAIADVLGSSVNIKCVVINARGNVPANMTQDGMVATALNQGGEIVDVQD